MNGVHDMGGMQGFGPIRPEANEPVFHEPWEGRMFALGIALIGQGLGGPPAWMEQLSPADYFTMSYYQKWYAGLTERAVRAGIITPEELTTGMAAPGLPKATPRLPASAVAERIARGVPGRLDIAVTPRFAVGQRARARNINPSTRTKLPRYVRGKVGVIERDHGVFNIVDTQLVRQEPQHVYSVRFSARELWGEQAKPKDSVYIDMWDDYLEAA